MLYFDRIDVSKGTGANKTKESKEYVFKYVCKHVFKVLIGEPNRSAAPSKIILKPWKTIHVTITASFGCQLQN